MNNFWSKVNRLFVKQFSPAFSSTWLFFECPVCLCLSIWKPWKGHFLLQVAFNYPVSMGRARERGTFSATLPNGWHLSNGLFKKVSHTSPRVQKTNKLQVLKELQLLPLKMEHVCSCWLNATRVMSVTSKSILPWQFRQKHSPILTARCFYASSSYVISQYRSGELLRESDTCQRRS